MTITDEDFGKRITFLFDTLYYNRYEPIVLEAILELMVQDRNRDEVETAKKEENRKEQTKKEETRNAESKVELNNENGQV